MSVLNLDRVQNIIESTVLNPWLTLPIYAALTTHRRRAPGISSLPSLFLGASLLRRLSLYLDDRFQNNWVDDHYDWTKELVVITGAGGAGGIANAVVKELSSHGVKIVILDVNEPDITYPGTQFYRCDLSSADDVQAAIAAIQADHGNPTVLIHVAGAWNKTHLLETSDEASKYIFAVNIFSQYQLIKAFAPSMAKNNHGMIVTTSSAIGFGTANPAMADYAATKSAAVAVHESLGSELAVIYKAPKIRTVLVVPKFVKTPLTEGVQYRSKFFQTLEPEDVGRKIADQVMSGRSGRVVVPKSLGWTEMCIRAWPVWLQKYRASIPSTTRSKED